MATARASAAVAATLGPERAIAVDVGVDDGGDPGVLEAAGEVDGQRLGGLRPALDGDAAVAGVDADGDAAGMGGGGAADELGVAEGRGAEDDAGDPLAEPALERGAVADAAAELDRDFDGARGWPRPPRR